MKDIWRDSARRASQAIYLAFEAWAAAFQAITQRARNRFELREWEGADADAVERLTLYRRVLDPLVSELPHLLSPRTRDRETWAEMKRLFRILTAERSDAEVAWTFFSSVSRRTFATVGADPAIEFSGDDFDQVPPAASRVVHATYPCGGPTAPVVRWMLDDLKFGQRYRDLSTDAALIAGVIDRHLAARGHRVAEYFEVLPAVFYRNTGAFLVGRIRAGGEYIPLVLALVHPEGGIRADAVLLTADDASIVFGFTRSYFHLLGQHPRAVVEFLQSIMPHKRVDELYTSIGYNKHGKTELYCRLLRHLADDPAARFAPAEGDKGLVMSVFALPSLQIVFKVIKDRFGFPKNITPQAVRDRYHFVFVHDRVGRLADAQEFEYLTFPRHRFEPAVLDELLREAPSSVQLAGNDVVLRHLYTERQVTPLNLYLQRADQAAAVRAIVDYGNAIKELAAANIFTGDMLLKNFGVTRHGRVVFYDYDELCLLTECQFRPLPQPATPEDEMSADAWFHVGDRDVFPEEFRPMLSLPGPLGQALRERHDDLMTVEFWRSMQQRHEAGSPVLDVRPYRAEQRLPVIFQSP